MNRNAIALCVLAVALTASWPALAEVKTLSCTGGSVFVVDFSAKTVTSGENQFNFSNVSISDSVIHFESEQSGVMHTNIDINRITGGLDVTHINLDPGMWELNGHSSHFAGQCKIVPNMPAPTKLF